MFIPFEFSATDELIIPHMGWNTVTQAKESKLFQDMYEESKFYFVKRKFLASTFIKPPKEYKVPCINLEPLFIY